MENHRWVRRKRKMGAKPSNLVISLYIEYTMGKRPSLVTSLVTPA
jgi:hypothetical protein